MEPIRDIKETAFNILSCDDFISFYSSDRYWCARIMKLKEKYPDAITITHMNKDGTFTARLPLGWLKVTPPIKRNLSDEQRKVLRERCLKMTEAKK